MKNTLLILIVALGVGCGEKKKSDNPHDMAWIPEKLSKEDSLRGQGHMMDSSEFYRNDSLFYVGEDAAKTSKFEPDNPLPWAMDMVASDKNGKIVEVVHGYEYSIINYKTVPEKGVFVDTTIWDDGFGYKNYFINILKDRRLIAKIKFDIHDCAQLKDYEVLVDKKYIEKLKPSVVKYGTWTTKRKVALKQGWCCDPGIPSSILMERLWKKSGLQWQVGDTTIVGDSSIKIPPNAGQLFKGIDTTKKGFSIYMGTDNIHPNASGIRRMNSMLKEMWDSIEKSISVIDATVDGLPVTNLKFMNDTFDYQVHYSIPGVFTFLPLYEYIEASTEAEAKEKFITLFTGRKYSILFIRDATVYNWRVWWEPLDGILEYPVYKDIPSETKSHAKDMFRWNNKDCRMVKIEKMERQKRYYK